MSYLELFIIYLTCGTPFGVFYFLQNKDEANFVKSWLMSILITLFWIPFSIKLFQTFVKLKLQNNKNSAESDFNTERKLRTAEFEKKYSQLLINNHSISLFDFKETFQRFVGLTFADSVSKTEDVKPWQDFNEFIEDENLELFSICLNRRNRIRLKQHQINARQEFLALLEKLNIGTNEKVQKISSEFAKFINDVEFADQLRLIIKNAPQNSTNFAVKNLENTVWKPIEQKPLLTQKTALNLRTMTAKVTMLKRD